MSNQWLRLWHDMPNDPKFRTVARVSGEPISLVLALYVHMLVDASQHVTRGHVTVTPEDLASALDVDENRVNAILNAMETRLIDGDYLTGWEKRQPKNEDAGNPETGAKSAAERKREQRLRERAAAEAEKAAASRGITQGHGESREVTTDKDKDKEERNTPPPPKGGDGGGESAKPTKAGEICKAIRLKGIADVNPSNPTLLAYIAQGVPLEVFEAAAKTCIEAKPPKGMAYLLGIVKRQLAEATAIDAAPGMPEKPWDESKSSILAMAAKLGMPPWDEAKAQLGQAERLDQYTQRVRRELEARQPQPA